MKRKVLFIAAVLIALSLIASGTFAFFTVEDTARNVVTSGGVSVTLLEQRRVESGLEPYPNAPIAVMPNTTVSKIVSVRGEDAAAWVRARYVVTACDAQGEPMTLSPEELARAVVIEPEGKSWAWRDGWWYCAEAVACGEETAPLFEAVTFSGENMGNEFQGATVTVELYVQAVQAANNGETAFDAIGWPPEETA